MRDERLLHKTVNPLNAFLHYRGNAWREEGILLKAHTPSKAFKS